MNRRIALAAVVVLALVGGFAWWSLARGADHASPQSTSGSNGEGTRPSSPAASSTPTGAATAAQTTVGNPLAACATTSPAGQIPSTFWGMHVGNPTGADFPKAPIGAVNLTTSGVYWNEVETAPGRYDFSRLDEIVATARARHTQPMVLLGFTPSFHASNPQSPTAKATMPNEGAWRAWVTAVVERYGARLDYQVWPEPNIVSNWTGTPEQMAKLTAVAGQIIHSHAPDAVVVAPATTLRLPTQLQWMDRFWATKVAGVPVADRVDAVALDPFPMQDGTPEDALQLVCSARQVLAKHGVDLPVWTNEINYGVPSGGTLTAKPYSDTKQAAVVARTYLLHAAIGVDRVYWLGWFAYPGVAVEMVRDGVTTPAGRAFTRIHNWLAGGTRPRCTVDAGIYSCLVTRGSLERRVLWRETGVSKVPAPAAARRVENLAGEDRPLTDGQMVRVSRSPVLITE